MDWHLEKVLKNLHTEISKAYGEFHGLGLGYTADRLNTLIEEIKDIIRGYECESDNQLMEDYEDYFNYSIYKSLRNKEDISTLDKAFRKYNMWAELVNDQRKVGMKEFKYLLRNNDIVINEDETLTFPKELTT